MVSANNEEKKWVTAQCLGFFPTHYKKILKNERKEKFNRLHHSFLPDLVSTEAVEATVASAASTSSTSSAATALAASTI